jgi:hypothetical protein
VHRRWKDKSPAVLKRMLEAGGFIAPGEDRLQRIQKYITVLRDEQNELTKVCAPLFRWMHRWIDRYVRVCLCMCPCLCMCVHRCASRTTMLTRQRSTLHQTRRTPSSKCTALSMQREVANGIGCGWARASERASERASKRERERERERLLGTTLNSQGGCRASPDENRRKEKNMIVINQTL